MSERVLFAAFGTKGGWRVEETSKKAFDWVKSLDPSDRGYYRIYRLRYDRDPYAAKYRLFRVMRDRYGIEPV